MIQRVDRNHYACSKALVGTEKFNTRCLQKLSISILNGKSSTVSKFASSTICLVRERLDFGVSKGASRAAIDIFVLQKLS